MEPRSIMADDLQVSYVHMCVCARTCVFGLNNTERTTNICEKLYCDLIAKLALLLISMMQNNNDLF